LNERLDNRTVEGNGPQIRVEQVGRCRKVEPGRWLCDWRVENLTGNAVELFTARVPHGKFRSEERNFGPPLKILGGESARVEMLVRCDELAGTVVENAFLILLIEWLNAQWRTFVRFLVTVDNDGRPKTRTESITTQRVGFSGVSD
jgi:hypothetical protein